MTEDPVDLIATTIQPSPEDSARRAVNRVLREESVDVTTKLAAYVKNRLTLTDQAFQHVQTIQNDLLDPETYIRLSPKEKIELLKVMISQMHILEVPIEEQKVTINQLNAQINNVMSEDKALVQLPRASRAKLKDTLLGLLKGGLLDVEAE